MAMNRWPVTWWMAAVAVAASTAFAGQPSAAPCTAAEYNQFDFWIGTWDVSWPASPTSGGKPGEGSNRIERTLDGCVVVEHFVGTPGLPLRGMSVSSYDRRIRRWRQTWVDNQGSYLDFTGSFANGQMVLQREASDAAGKKFLQRMVWTDIARDSFDWRWERSDDGGKSWTLLWPIQYRRRAAASNE